MEGLQSTARSEFVSTAQRKAGIIVKNTSPVHKESRILLAIYAMSCVDRTSAGRFVMATVHSFFRVITIQRLLWYRRRGNKTRLFHVYYLSHRAPEDMRLPKPRQRQRETYTCFGIHRSTSNLDSSVLCDRVPDLLNFMKYPWPCRFGSSSSTCLAA